MFLKKVRSILASEHFVSLLLFSVCSVFLLSACGVDKTASTDATDTDEDTGASVPDPTDGFSVLVTTNDNYSVLFSKDGDGSTDCVAEEGDLITCIVDMEENDLFFNGVKVGYAAPQDQCDYIGVMQYYYSWAPVGYMPAAVFYQTRDDAISDASASAGGEPTWLNTIIEDGPAGNLADTITIANAINGVGSNAGTYNCTDVGGDTSTDIIYGFDTDTDGRIDTLVCHRDLYFGLPASESADLKCPWDYSGIEGGSSCCYGDYTAFTYDGADSTNAEASWGTNDSYGNCFRGPAMDNVTTKNAFGLPAFVQTLVPTAGLQASFDVAAPDSKHDEQIYASNYFEVGDHTGETVVRAGIHGNSITAPTLAAFGYPVFEIDCLDHAYELKAQIRIQIREWNLSSEYAKFVAGTSATSNSEDVSDPYGTGVNEQEEDFCDYRGLQRDTSGADTTAGNELTCSYNTYGSFGLSTSVETLGLVRNPSDFYGVIPAE